MLIAYVPQEGIYEYYGGKLETNFPDTTYFGNFKVGKYYILLQADEPANGAPFTGTFSYYH